MRAALTAQDRCDRCGARAVAASAHSGTEMLWCQHHYDKYREKLAPALVLYEPYREPVLT